MPTMKNRTQKYRCFGCYLENLRRTVWFGGRGLMQNLRTSPPFCVTLSDCSYWSRVIKPKGLEWDHLKTIYYSFNDNPKKKIVFVFLQWLFFDRNSLIASNQLLIPAIGKLGLQLFCSWLRFLLFLFATAAISFYRLILSQQFRWVLNCSI